MENKGRIETVVGRWSKGRGILATRYLDPRQRWSSASEDRLDNDREVRQETKGKKRVERQKDEQLDVTRWTDARSF